MPHSYSLLLDQQTLRKIDVFCRHIAIFTFALDLSKPHMNQIRTVLPFSLF